MSRYNDDERFQIETQNYLSLTRFLILFEIMFLIAAILLKANIWFWLVSFSRCALLLTESSDMQCSQMSTTQKRPIFRLKIHFVQEEMAIIIDSLNGWGWFLKLFLINLRIFCMDYLETHPFRKKKSYIMSFETVIIVVFSFGITWKIIENRRGCFYLRSCKQCLQVVVQASIAFL